MVGEERHAGEKCCRQGEIAPGFWRKLIAWMVLHLITFTLPICIFFYTSLHIARMAERDCDVSFSHEANRNDEKNATQATLDAQTFFPPIPWSTLVFSHDVDFQDTGSKGDTLWESLVPGKLLL